MSTIYSGEVGAHPPHPPLLPSLPSPPCPSTPSRIGLGAGWVGLFAVSVLTAALAATAPVVDPSVVKFSAREAAASFAPEHVLAVVLAEWELCRAEGERSPAFPRRRSRGRPFQPCMGRGPTPLWRTVMVCVDERLFHAPIAPQFVKSENGVSYVGCDFPCVTAEEALNHRTDHGDKFSLLPSVEHVDHFPQLNHQLLNFILRQISLFDNLSTFKGHGEVVVRPIALTVSNEAIARGTPLRIQFHLLSQFSERAPAGIENFMVVT